MLNLDSCIEITSKRSFDFGTYVSVFFCVYIAFYICYAEISRYWRSSPYSHKGNYRILVKCHKGNPFANRPSKFLLFWTDSWKFYIHLWLFKNSKHITWYWVILVKEYVLICIKYKRNWIFDCPPRMIIQINFLN